ncbi:MAG: lipid-A-disaccharide synthase [Alphaproteobacteria bacterium]|nr:lipid-A-disaccharide synthase [Alphaproteobacteria bacterium]MBV9966013.1 lipid-A-disaccharide synthase [Alphaproteobacteria bacterium]
MTTGGHAAPFIFLIAGEPSGDVLGSALIAALRERAGSGLRVAGIGGEAMAQQGLSSLAPLSDLAVAGIAEVLPRAPLILRHVRQAVRAIRDLRPDAVVTIDSSGFSWRVAHALRRYGEGLPLIHYVAPMVWAWRPGRARRMARWYDHLLTLLPFEPPYFERVGLASTYVGHPVVESGAELGDAARFRATYGIADGETVLTVLPGSRGGEVQRLLPIFGAALRQLEPRTGPFRVAVPTVETVADVVTAGVGDWPGRPVVLRGVAAKFDAFAASRAAMAASGTVALELALARVPMVVGYRLNPLTEALLARVLKVRHVNLVNLILGRALVPELLGARCTPEQLAGMLAELVGDERVRSAHLEGYDEAMRRLGAGSLSPSRKAAERILAIIAARRRGEPGSNAKEQIPDDDDRYRSETGRSG